jgi:hypothetical protein
VSDGHRHNRSKTAGRRHIGIFLEIRTSLLA